MTHAPAVDLHYLELTELAELLRRREVTSVEVTRAQLARIDCLDSHLASYACVTAEQALPAAEAADAEIAAGRYRGPLHGIPLGIKDLFWVKGVPAAAGTVIHRDFVPQEDASVVARLKQAGAVLLGKLQMTEGAYSDHHPAITPPKNPWNAEYWTGISSSGSAVAIAAGLCYGSLASDTGGSIRWPCGATGLAPAPSAALIRPLSFISAHPECFRPRSSTSQRSRITGAADGNPLICPGKAC